MTDTFDPKLMFLYLKHLEDLRRKYPSMSPSELAPIARELAEKEKAENDTPLPANQS